MKSAEAADKQAQAEYEAAKARLEQATAKLEDLRRQCIPDFNALAAAMEEVAKAGFALQAAQRRKDETEGNLNDARLNYYPAERDYLAKQNELEYQAIVAKNYDDAQALVDRVPAIVARPGILSKAYDDKYGPLPPVPPLPPLQHL